MLNRVTSKWIGAIAASVAISAAYFAATTSLLSHSTLQVYGFPVSPDLRTGIEIALQICPIMAALCMILISSLREKLILRLAQRFTPSRWSGYTLTMLAVSMGLALATTALTAAAILTMCGLRRDGVHTGTLLWVAFEFIIDISLVGIFTVFLHALTRRVWATFLIFLLYAVAVVVFGTKWGMTSFIGFGSTVPIQLSSYSSEPLYDAAGWLFRIYWVAAAGVMVAILNRFARPSESLIAAVYKEWPSPENRRWKYRFAAVCTAWVAIAACLLQFQQLALSKYRTVSPGRLDHIISQGSGDARLQITDYNLELAYEPEQQRVNLHGKLTLTNKESGMAVAYLQLPSVLTLDNLHLEGGGSYKTTNLGKYLRIEWASPLPTGQHFELRYSGTIHSAGPFDLTLQGKLLKEAFFLTDSDLAPSPRRPSCLISDQSLLKGTPPCEKENYAMSDLATGTIRVTAPEGFIAAGPGERQIASGRESVFKVAAPELTRFMVACARFATTYVAAADGLPAVQVYSAEAQGKTMAQTGRSVISYYQKHWPPYQTSELRIVETPTPLGEAVAFDGLLAIGDRIARSRDPISGQTSGLAQFVVAHELAHQWWGYQVVPAKAPGQLFVLESFAQFSAYKYLESRGILSNDAAIQNEKKYYEIARERLAKNEVPLALLKQNDLELAYHKGPYVLLSLDKMSGNSLINIFGDLIKPYEKASSNPAQPEEILESLVGRLPPSTRGRAHSLLFAASTQVQSAARSARPYSSEPIQKEP